MMEREVIQRSFPECNIFQARIIILDEPQKCNDGFCILDILAMAREAIDAALEPEIEVVSPPPDWAAIDEAWFSESVAVEGLLARQGTDPGDDELDPVELEALRASERSRGGA